MRRHAEEVAVAARFDAETRTGRLAGVDRIAGVARLSSQKAAEAVKLAESVNVLSAEPFGESLCRRVARSLRSGFVVVPNSTDGDGTRKGVGLSYAGAARRDTLQDGECLSAVDMVSYSVDSYSAPYLAQRCAPVELASTGPHMGPNGLSALELAPEACNDLPPLLQWIEEAQFVRFLAGHSEQSLALLLGSDARGGSLTRLQLEEAAMAGDPRGGDFASEEAVRSLNKILGAVNALERAVLAVEDSTHAGHLLSEAVPVGAGTMREAAMPTLRQVLAQSHSLEAQARGVPVETLGLVRSSAACLQQDALRHIAQLRDFATRALQRAPGVCGGKNHIASA